MNRLTAAPVWHLERTEISKLSSIFLNTSVENGNTEVETTILKSTPSNSNAFEKQTPHFH